MVQQVPRKRHFGTLLFHLAVHAGTGVAPPPPDPAVVVTFAGTPGLGKTELCTQLHKRLAARHVVVHHHSDALQISARKYWSQAASLSVTHRGDGKATVVLADKNLVDNPRGTWRKASLIYFCFVWYAVMFSNSCLRSTNCAHSNRIVLLHAWLFIQMISIAISQHSTMLD
jgi:hypothetical protein